MQRATKQEWILEKPSFRRLLVWLDHGVDSGGQRYLDMQQRLVAYFDRRNCSAPDELADETLNRVARRLEEEGVVESDVPARFCYTTAKFVFMERLREAKRADLTLDQMRRLDSGNEQLLTNEAAAEKESRLQCLDACLGNLDSANRELIMRYYVGKERTKIENRRALAQSLGITMNALSIRACRIREKLERCVCECIAKQ